MHLLITCLQLKIDIDTLYSDWVDLTKWRFCGKYIVILPKGGKYKVSIKSEGYLPFFKEIVTSPYISLE